MPHDSLTFAGETLQLLPEQALWWDREYTVFLSDLHLGRVRRKQREDQGKLLESIEEPLRRLGDVLDRLPARRVVILGDLVHAPVGYVDLVVSSVATWRRAFARLEILLIRGNHEDRAGDPPATWHMQVESPPFRLGPFDLRHLPDHAATGQVLAGHLHPACRLPGENKRYPCLVVEAGQLVFPAFGRFVSTTPIEPAHGRELYLFHKGRVTRP